ncbi:ArsR/SmtB family transcription factor [Neorhizobium alkalisoli]|uniref:ArsR family transcriptional regulator n=1 Tax=Neorhizobium alkalisoli TaxID=528178 RepID=A0A561QAZ8_9HYPH|nr:metalloregulator ArsR/SmtB family transcription factor [Neorhizobium alkalisoli]TWF47530.1 ArsR family transcriptional regulator [Neorhizobium alkalisoli]
MKRASTLLTAMSNPRRLQVLSLIARQEIAVGVLAEQIGLSQSALSQHLAKLRRAGSVKTRRDSQHTYYSCRSAAVLTVLSALEAIAWTEQAAAPSRAKAKVAG